MELPLPVVKIETRSPPRFPISSLLIKKSEWGLSNDDPRIFKGQLMIQHYERVLAEITADNKIGDEYLEFYFFNNLYPLYPQDNQGMPYFRADCLINDPVDVRLLVYNSETQEWDYVTRPMNPSGYYPLTNLYAPQAAFPFTMSHFDEAKGAPRHIIFFDSWGGIPAFLEMDVACRPLLPPPDGENDPKFPKLPSEQGILRAEGDYVTLKVPLKLVRDHVKNGDVLAVGIGQLCSYDPHTALINFPGEDILFEANLCATRLYYDAWNFTGEDATDLATVFVVSGWFPQRQVYDFPAAPVPVSES